MQLSEYLYYIFAIIIAITFITKLSKIYKLSVLVIASSVITITQLIHYAHIDTDIIYAAVSIALISSMLVIFNYLIQNAYNIFIIKSPYKIKEQFSQYGKLSDYVENFQNMMLHEKYDRLFRLKLSYMLALIFIIIGVIY
ncbi:MAG: hypothetical protein SFT93_03460 [Rickettsiaceae bacterium]|nr:hypothetical protein [Rickettsiaceae bacterium]